MHKVWRDDVDNELVTDRNFPAGTGLVVEEGVPLLADVARSGYFLSGVLGAAYLAPGKSVSRIAWPFFTTVGYTLSKPLWSDAL